MKVTSPIGELPFTVLGVTFEDGHVVVRGELGAWRSRIELGGEDVPMLARALRGPLIAAGAAAAAVVLLRRL
jgi:hypothetical protein